MTCTRAPVAALSSIKEPPLLLTTHTWVPSEDTAAGGWNAHPYTCGPLNVAEAFDSADAASDPPETNRPDPTSNRQMPSRRPDLDNIAPCPPVRLVPRRPSRIPTAERTPGRR